MSRRLMRSRLVIPPRMEGSLARWKEALWSFPDFHPGSLSAGEIVPVEPDGRKDDRRGTSRVSGSRVTRRSAT